MPTDLLQFIAGMKLVHLLISWTKVQAGGKPGEGEFNRNQWTATQV